MKADQKKEKSEREPATFKRKKPKQCSDKIFLTYNKKTPFNLRKRVYVDKLREEMEKVMKDVYSCNLQLFVYFARGTLFGGSSRLSMRDKRIFTDRSIKQQAMILYSIRPDTQSHCRSMGTDKPQDKGVVED